MFCIMQLLKHHPLKFQIPIDLGHLKGHGIFYSTKNGRWFVVLRKDDFELNNYVSLKELDEIAEELIKKFLGKDKDCFCIDIDRFAIDYLGLNIEYVNFAEDDLRKTGFLGNGEASILIWLGKRKFKYVCPEKTILIDKYLLDKSEQNKRRFVVAHEAAHFILNKINKKQIAAFHNEFDSEVRYTPSQLQSMMTFNELQADRLGAALLMPRFAIEKNISKTINNAPLTLYGKTYIDRADKQKIRLMAEKANVSYTSLLIRMKNLNLFRQGNLGDYLLNELNIGGDVL